jgi:hypothetical protein
MVTRAFGRNGTCSRLACQTIGTLALAPAKMLESA